MRVAALALLGALAFVAAGCGGGSRPTLAQFDKKTSSICAGYTKRARTELAPLQGNPLSPNAKPEELARLSRLLQHVATLFGQQLADLSQVRPPSGSAQRYAQVLRLYGQIEGAVSRAARAARRGDKVGVATAEQELSALGQEASALGFKCG